MIGGVNRSNLGSGIWDLESGIWNLESGIWNLESPRSQGCQNSIPQNKGVNLETAHYRNRVKPIREEFPPIRMVRRRNGSKVFRVDYRCIVGAMDGWGRRPVSSSPANRHWTRPSVGISEVKYLRELFQSVF